MGERTLTIDLGNSRAKLGLFEWRGSHFEFEDERVVPTGPRLLEDVRDFLDTQGRVFQALLSCVGPRDVEAVLAAFLEERFGEEFLHNPAVAMRIDYRPEASLGRDRLYAALGAVHVLARGTQHESHGAALVVDAGTALTVDAVSGFEEPVFHGGAIAPGPTLLAEALHRHTARLPRVEPRSGAHALAHDTESALQAGIVVGFRGAAQELVRRVAEEAGFGPKVPVVLSGGAHEFLVRPDSCFAHRRVVLEAHLVHKGLLAALWHRRT